ncbi:hypothetical protein CLAIMM_01975 [Cladophialophora immunda]|nr:hypothetical protein CLAIMM_01975 [Cladophialophora immunda]
MRLLGCTTRRRPFRARNSLQRRLSFSARHYGRPDPARIADDLMRKFSAGQTFVREQLLDANQLRLTGLTLDRPYLWRNCESLQDKEPAQGTPLPAGYHLVYFTPIQPNASLGRDGTDASFNPDKPFTRRMWAGGSCAWPGAASPGDGAQSWLTVGEVATEVTRILSCEAKVQRKGEDMLVVGVEKEFRNSKGDLCVLDRRNWVFRPALDPANSSSVSPPQSARPLESSGEGLKTLPGGYHMREYNRDEAVLFRFSALTFNAHRIHYDKTWAMEVEGHRGLVVHGPMNLIAMLDLWRDEVAGVSHEEVVYPARIDYRAVSPVYAREPYRVLASKETTTQEGVEVKVVSHDGTLCMKGTIEG